MSTATWICCGRYGFPPLPVTDTLTWLSPSAAGVTVTVTSPRPPGPPVLNGTVAVLGSVKVSRAVAVLTSTAVTASIAEAIIASAATDQRSLRSVTPARPDSGDEPLDEPSGRPSDEPFDEPLPPPWPGRLM